MTNMTLAVDAMGGDGGCQVTIPAVAQLLDRYADLNVILVGLADELSQALKDNKLMLSERLQLVEANEIVEGSDPVSVALRKKRHSSMRLAINLVRDGKAQAVVSAGNTGALMALSRFVLKTQSGIDRPAICSAIPTLGSPCYMLDLGANVDVDAEHLMQFALMGRALAGVKGIANPRIALLNVGEEEIKGNHVIKAAASDFTELSQRDSSFNYVGFVEGDGVFRAEADVVVCDGLVGNVALKSMEGVASLISQFIRDEAKRSLIHRLAALCALPLFKSLKAKMNPDTYNGASFLGLNGVVVKSHGGSGVEGFLCALEVARSEAECRLPNLIESAMERSGVTL